VKLAPKRARASLAAGTALKTNCLVVIWTYTDTGGYVCVHSLDLVSQADRTSVACVICSPPHTGTSTQHHPESFGPSSQPTFWLLALTGKQSPPQKKKPKIPWLRSCVLLIVDQRRRHTEDDWMCMRVAIVAASATIALFSRVMVSRENSREKSTSARRNCMTSIGTHADGHTHTHTRSEADRQTGTGFGWRQFSVA